MREGPKDPLNSFIRIVTDVVVIKAFKRILMIVDSKII